MTETQTGQQAGQSVNGKAPAPEAEPAAAPDTGEKYLAWFLFAAAGVIAVMAYDRLTGKVSALLDRERDDASG